jgi:aminopeptidase YwaD
MMKTAKGILLILFCSIFSFTSFAQYGKNVMERLVSPSFHGRGYYKNGDARAAKYIRNEFRKTGLQPVGNNYYQNFTFPVNTFPGKMKIKLGEKNLVPGKDFIVSPAAPSVKGTFLVMNVSLPLPDFKSKDYSETFLLVDKSGADSTGSAKLDSLMRNPPNVKGVIIAEPKKLTWSVSTKVNDIVFIRILKDALPAKAEQITLNIQNRFVESYATQNVIGLIPGTTNADSFIVFTAHYDHLGRMGKNALFAGANDNASGTAMIMELARHYSKPENRIGKSILFMAFAAEEAGLIGSKYYVDNPLLPIDKIRFLINLDLMGNGEEGMMVVNGELHETEFAMLEEINLQKQLLKTIGKRGTARNSDHYWFSHNGVPAFFLYTTGGSKAYHDIYDTPQQLPMDEFDDIQTLLKDFVSKLGQ